MNGNLFVTEAKNGRRSNSWRLITTTGSKRKRHAFWGSAPTGICDRPARSTPAIGRWKSLWDCITLLDGQTVAELNARGGIRAIAIPHPHYYTTMVNCAKRFDAQIFLHTADREWVMRRSPRIPILGRNNAFVVGWSDSRCKRKGALLTVDIIQVGQPRSAQNISTRNRTEDKIPHCVSNRHK
jgi:hypothetical protein